MEGFLRRPKYFVLFDLNGTLVYKTNKRLKCSREPDKSIKKLVQIYIRPDIAQLLPPLLNSPSVRVCIYSSMRRQTISPIIDAVLEKIGAIDKKEAITIFDRNYCIPDPMGDIQDTLKDLSSVWEGKYAKERGMNKYNTLLVENDIRKASKCIPNLLRMVPYQESDVVNPSLEKDSILHYYGEYIKKLVESGTSDIPEYLKKNKLPLEVTKHFEQTTEELIRAQEEIRKLTEEEKSVDQEEKWVNVEEIPDKEEKMKEMMKLIESITITIEKQD